WMHLTHSLTFFGSDVPTNVVVMSRWEVANCRASSGRLAFLFRQWATALAHRSRTLAGAGGHFGGPFSVSKPIPSGAALMMPTCFTVASGRICTSVVFVRQKWQ